MIGIDTDPSFFDEFFALWREFGEKNALWGELRREQRGEKIPFKYNRIARIGYAVDRINFMRCSYGSANNRPLKKHITVMIVVSLVSNKPIRTPILTVSVIATVLSLAPLLYGIRFFSIIGAFISVALLLTTVVAFLKEHTEEAK